MDKNAHALRIADSAMLTHVVLKSEKMCQRMQCALLKRSCVWLPSRYLRVCVSTTSIRKVFQKPDRTISSSPNPHFCCGNVRYMSSLLFWFRCSPLLPELRHVCSRRFMGTYRKQRESIGDTESDFDESIWSEFELKSDGTLDGVSSFSDIGVSPSLCKALEVEGITTPTTVQDKALPATLRSNAHCMIKSETGSGKTLVFLLPALQEKLPGLTTLIIVPSRELAVQILYQAENLGRNIKRSKRIMALYSGPYDSDAALLKYSETKPHVLLATPKVLLQLMETNIHNFRNIQRVVLDEVDKLLLTPSKKMSWKKKAKRDLHPRPAKVAVEKLLKMKGTKPQLIATSATLGEDVRDELTKIGWGEQPKVINVSEIVSTNTLVSPSAIEHRYLECDDTTLGKANSQRDKLDTLVEHFRSGKDQSALVFIHRGAPITRFVQELQKRKIRVEPLHEHVQEATEYSRFLEAFRTGEIEMVVATEETVRGLDFPWLEIVYLLEVPRTASEYLHLCGRVGRVKRCGQAVVVVENAREKSRMENHYRKLGVKSLSC